MPQPVLEQKTVEQFLEKLRSEQKNERVIASYRNAVRSLGEISKENPPVLTKDLLETWRVEQEKKGYASQEGDTGI